MADNTTLNSGSGGDIIATDDIADAGVANGAKVQRVKSGFGSNNNYSDPTGNAGTVDAGTARVTLATDVALPAGTNVIGKTDGIDAENAAVTANPKLIGGRYDATPRALGDGDAGAIALDSDGSAQVKVMNSEDVFAFQTTSTLTNGTSYDSGVLTLSPDYSQVQTHVFASHDGEITITWYSDAGGTDLVRTLVIPYTASRGFEMFAAPAFTPYNKYVFLNNSGSNQTDFYFDTKFMRRSISPQVLRVDATVAAGMVASVQRSLITAYNGSSYTNVNATNGGNLKVSLSEASDGLDIGAGNAGGETIRVSVATDDVNLSAIKTAVELIDNAISGTEMQVDVLTSALPTGAATSANQSTANTSLSNIETAVQLIDDPVATDDTTTHTAATTKVMGIGAVATPTDTNLDANDIGMPAMSLDRRLHTDAQIVGQDAALDVSGATVTVDLSTNNDVQGAVAEGAAVSGNPFLIAGDDGTNVKHIAVAADGAIHIDDGGNSITVDNADLTTLAGAVSGTEMQVDVLTSALPTGAATSANQSTANGHLSTLAGAVSGTEMQADILSIAAGSNLVGDVGISGARTSGGTTFYKNIDVDESEDQVKGTAGQLYWIHAINLGSSVRYLKIYNATAATVVVGTTVPDLTFPIPTQGDANGAGFSLSIPNGIAFGTAITIAATTGAADNDSGAPGANEVIVNLGYA